MVLLSVVRGASIMVGSGTTGDGRGRALAGDQEPIGHDASAPSPRATPAAVTVYLVDDHALMRRGIREVLESAGGITVVGESGTAQEAVRRIPALRPDVMLLDVKLPDGSGVDVCRRVRGVDPAIAALMITTYDDDEARSASLAAGAAGFVLKEVEVADLVRDVRRVARGDVLVGPAADPVADHDVDVEPGLLDRLTRQERRVLSWSPKG